MLDNGVEEVLGKGKNVMEWEREVMEMMEGKIRKM